MKAGGENKVTTTRSVAPSFNDKWEITAKARFPFDNRDIWVSPEMSGRRTVQSLSMGNWDVYVEGSAGLAAIESRYNLAYGSVGMGARYIFNRHYYLEGLIAKVGVTASNNEGVEPLIGTTLAYGAKTDGGFGMAVAVDLNVYGQLMRRYSPATMVLFNQSF